MKKGPTEKNSNLLHSQGMYYEYDGLKFKSKEELKSYVDSTKKNGKGISEEKTVEDAKATEEIAEADVIAKEKAEEKEAARIAEVDRIAQEKAAVRVAKEKADEKEAARIAEVDRVAQEKAAVRVAQEKADAIAKEKAKSSRENIRNIKSDEINKSKATKYWWLA